MWTYSVVFFLISHLPLMVWQTPQRRHLSVEVSCRSWTSWAASRRRWFCRAATSGTWTNTSFQRRAKRSTLERSLVVRWYEMGGWMGVGGGSSWKWCWMSGLIKVGEYEHVGIAIINHRILIVYTNHLWWLGGWFIAIPTLLMIDWSILIILR